MIKSIFTTLILLSTFLTVKAQEVQPEVYEGKMNGEIPITLYLQSYENGCTTDIMYDGMYKYNGKSEWLQLKITTNDNSQFILVEYRFTGVMILKKGDNSFDGIWISPDSKRQLKVNLHKVENSEEKMNALRDKFEEVNYENNDC